MTGLEISQGPKRCRRWLKAAVSHLKFKKPLQTEILTQLEATTFSKEQHKLPGVAMESSGLLRLYLTNQQKLCFPSYLFPSNAETDIM